MYTPESTSVRDHINQGSEVIKRAPLAALALVAVGFGMETLVYGERFAGLQQQNENYRRALGVDPPYDGVLAELTNDELKQKSSFIVSTMRSLHLTMLAR